MAWSEDKVERLIDRYVKRDELMLDRIRRMEKSSIGFDSGSSPITIIECGKHEF